MWFCGSLRLDCHPSARSETAEYTVTKQERHHYHLREPSESNEKRNISIFMFIFLDICFCLLFFVCFCWNLLAPRLRSRTFPSNLFFNLIPHQLCVGLLDFKAFSRPSSLPPPLLPLLLCKAAAIYHQLHPRTPLSGFYFYSFLCKDIPPPRAIYRQLSQDSPLGPLLL